MKSIITPLKRGFLTLLFMPTIVCITVLQPIIALADSYNISDTGSTGGFSLIANFFQSAVDFMIGPFAKGTIAITIIGAVLLWIAMPKEGVMGIVCRAVIGALVILNIATWMNMFGG